MDGLEYGSGAEHGICSSWRPRDAIDLDHFDLHHRILADLLVDGMPDLAKTDR